MTCRRYEDMEHVGAEQDGLSLDFIDGDNDCDRRI